MMSCTRSSVVFHRQSFPLRIFRWYVNFTWGHLQRMVRAKPNAKAGMSVRATIFVAASVGVSHDKSVLSPIRIHVLIVAAGVDDDAGWNGVSNCAHRRVVTTEVRHRNLLQFRAFSNPRFMRIRSATRSDCFDMIREIPGSFSIRTRRVEVKTSERAMSRQKSTAAFRVSGFVLLLFSRAVLAVS